MSIEQESKKIVILQDLDTYLYQCSFHAILQLRKLMSEEDVLNLIDNHLDELKVKIKIPSSKSEPFLNLDKLYNKYNNLYEKAVINDDSELDYYSDMVSSIKKVQELIDSEEN